jgi:ATP synthase protein I
MPAAPDGHPTSGPLSPKQASAVALRTALVPSVVVGVIAVVVGWFVDGGLGALGALLGALVAIAFFAGGQYVLGRILSGNPDFALSAGLLLYLTQVLILFGLIVLLRGATWLNGRIFGIAVLVVTIAWIAGSLIATNRTKVLYADPANPAPGSAPAVAAAGSDAEADAVEAARQAAVRDARPGDEQ